MAVRWAETSAERTAARQQQFVWRSLAEPYRPARHDFDLADIALNRLTEPYRPALSLARALLFGFDLSSPAPNTQIYAPVFDLAALFETLVFLVAETASVGSDLLVSAQTSERRAIVSASGETYRRIRPDLVMTAESAPVLVVDSKFKPKYATGGPVPNAAHRVSREDIFQTFFYASRLAQQASCDVPVAAAIAAPRLASSGISPGAEYRQIRWGEDTGAKAAHLTLLLVPVEEAVSAVRAGDVDFCRGIFAETPVVF